MRKALKDLLFLIAILLFLTPLELSAFTGIEEDGDDNQNKKEVKWRPSALIPSYLRFQFAGQVGVFSVGGGYDFLNEKLKVEGFYGYMPAQNNFNAIHTVGVKGTFLFWEIPLNLFFDSFSPIISTSINMTVGGGGNVFWRLPSYFPDAYYAPNFIRFCPAIGVNFTKYLKPYTFIRRFEFYFEFVTNNVYATYFIKNREVGLTDIFSLDLGLRIRF